MGMRDMFSQRKALEADLGAPVAAPAGNTQFTDAERLALLDAFEQTGIGWFWASDREHRLTYLSPAAQSHFPSRESVIGVGLAELLETVLDAGEGAEPRPLTFILNAHSSLNERTVRLLRESHETEAFWAVSGKPQFDAEQRFIGYRGSAKDITVSYRERRDSQRLADYDSLTGLANRQRMEKRLESMLATMCPNGRSCALLLLDLDKFKQVNDTLGHPAGDELLRQVAQRLQQIVTGNAEIGRLGGDEFQIILPDLDDRGRLGELSDQIIKMLSQPFVLEEGRALIGASIGVAVAPFDGTEPTTLIKSADLALYASKGGGRGQYRFYSEDLKDVASEQRELETELLGALERGELEVHYQPIVDARDNTVRAFEALMRWNHPDRGLIESERFVPLAEELGIMGELGEWSLRKACSDAAQWPDGIRVAVNISARQFGEATFLETVQGALHDSGLAATLLELEITEAVFMGESEVVENTFAQLQRLHISLTLDDFGTGYTSLSFLRGAPFSRIKIDQNFVSGCTEANNPNAAIVTAFVSLATALGMQSTAEGVEVLDELEMVRSLGVDMVQGFVFSRAVPQARVLEKLADGNFHYEPAGPRTYRAERRAMFRRIGVIHGDNRYEAVLRNLSRTGALIEGIIDVPVGTQLVLDMGQGQLAVATVRRSQDATQGVEFETPLVSDGADGLCTRHRVSPHVLATNGITGQEEPSEEAVGEGGTRRFMQVNVSAGSNRAA